MNTYSISNESITSIGRDPRNTFYAHGQINKHSAMKAVPGEKVNQAEILLDPDTAAGQETEYNIVDKFLYLTGMFCIIVVCSLVFIL